MADAIVIGLRGEADFDTLVSHFTGLGGDVVLLNPDLVCGRSHITSAVQHAERAFERKTNRSKNILTETILYAAGERQIGKALEKMRPIPGSGKMAAAIFGIEDLRLESIGMTRDDSLLEPSDEKLRRLGIIPEPGISAEKLALEHVAAVDLLKQ